MRGIVAATLDRYGSIHILINNAGVLRPTAVIDIEEAEWDLVVNVNLKGTYLCSRAVLPAMREAGWGRIVNFSSTAGKNVSTVGGAHYTAAKAGVLGFTRHLAKEAAPYGITVNAVCPGLIDTEMVRATISDEQTERLRRQLSHRPLGPPGGGRRAGRVPRLRPRRLHHRRVARHQRRRPHDLGAAAAHVPPLTATLPAPNVERGRGVRPCPPHLAPCRAEGAGG